MNTRPSKPFALSLSKGEWRTSNVRSWFDKLTTNGKQIGGYFKEIKP